MSRHLILALFLLSPSCFALFETASLEEAKENGISLATGPTYVCAMDSSGRKCWGDYSRRDFFQRLPRETAESVGATNSHVCWLNKGEVHCQRYSSPKAERISSLKNPRALAVGEYRSCVIEDRGVKCWDAILDPIKDIPKFKNPRQLALGGLHSCALDDEGVKCWGQNLKGQLKVPPLRNPQQITAGDDHSCALDDEGVKCWGSNEFGQVTVIPLQRPKQISAGHHHNCALDDKGIQCWGRSNEYQIYVPQPLNPLRVYCGGDFSCAVEERGVWCWGGRPKSEVRETPSEFWDVLYLGSVTDNFKPRLEALAKVSYAPKRDFYLGLAKAVANLPTKGEGIKPRYLALLLARAVMENTDSSIVIGKMPRYRESLLKIEAVHKLSLANLEVSEMTLRLSFEAVRLSQNASKSFLVSANARESLEYMVSRIGLLRAQSGSLPLEELAGRLNFTLQTHKTLIDSLTDAPRTSGFGKVLKIIEQHLGTRSEPW